MTGSPLAGIVASVADSGTLAVSTAGLGKQYRSRVGSRATWALRDCTLQVPVGRICGLVGANGAGKTTLLKLLVGLCRPSAGSAQVLGRQPGDNADFLSQVGYLAQDIPLYRRLTVADHLAMGARLNPAWDDAVARNRLRSLGIPLRQRVGTLSGGQRAQLALTLAVAKRPELLILDEPVAALDPLARREFLQTLMEVVATSSVSVVLSSHLIADLERVCDYLVVLVSGRVAIEGDVDTLLEGHRRLVGPRRDAVTLPGDQTVIESSHAEKQSTFIVRTDGPILDPAWTVSALSLDDLVLAYMRQARDGTAAPAAPGLAAVR